VVRDNGNGRKQFVKIEKRDGRKLIRVVVGGIGGRNDGKGENLKTVKDNVRRQTHVKRYARRTWRLTLLDTEQYLFSYMQLGINLLRQNLAFILLDTLWNLFSLTEFEFVFRHILEFIFLHRNCIYFFRHILEFIFVDRIWHLFLRHTLEFIFLYRIWHLLC